MNVAPRQQLSFRRGAAPHHADTEPDPRLLFIQCAATKNPEMMLDFSAAAGLD
jgi:hypothetical protein